MVFDKHTVLRTYHTGKFQHPRKSPKHPLFDTPLPLLCCSFLHHAKIKNLGDNIRCFKTLSGMLMLKWGHSFLAAIHFLPTTLSPNFSNGQKLYLRDRSKLLKWAKSVPTTRKFPQMSKKHGFPSVSENSKSCFTVPWGKGKDKEFRKAACIAFHFATQHFSQRIAYASLLHPVSGPVATSTLVDSNMGREGWGPALRDPSCLRSCGGDRQQQCQQEIHM